FQGKITDNSLTFNRCDRTANSIVFGWLSDKILTYSGICNKYNNEGLNECLAKIRYKDAADMPKKYLDTYFSISDCHKGDIFLNKTIIPGLRMKEDDGLEPSISWCQSAPLCTSVDQIIYQYSESKIIGLVAAFSSGISAYYASNVHHKYILSASGVVFTIAGIVFDFYFPIDSLTSNCKKYTDSELVERIYAPQAFERIYPSAKGECNNYFEIEAVNNNWQSKHGYKALDDESMKDIFLSQKLCEGKISNLINKCRKYYNEEDQGFTTKYNKYLAPFCIDAKNSYKYFESQYYEKTHDWEFEDSKSDYTKEAIVKLSGDLNLSNHHTTTNDL
ncbi:hypothetical protein SZ25_00863, partial [Candidatus Arcanobacter lacustris]